MTNRSLTEFYKNCIEEGISIGDLYIYTLLLEDGRCYGKEEDEILTMIEEVRTTASIIGRGYEDAVQIYLETGVPDLYIDEDDEEWE